LSRNPALELIVVEQEETASYSQIAKSTGIFGGSQVINILIGIIRTKVLAVLLGTAGIGLAGLYQSVIDFVKSIAGLGLSFSSVKDISEAANTNDQQRIAQTVTVLHKFVWWTGLTGMILMIAFSYPISLYAFGDGQHVWPICLLSFCVLTGLLSSGQIALLQGTRQILKMAKASVYGTIGGFIVAVIFYAWLGIKGIVPALIGISLISLFFSWYFSRQERVQKVQISFRQTICQGGAMLKLGFFSMLSGLASTLTLLLMKSFIVKAGNLDMVGLYQAVWSISFMYLSTILSAMAADYYPHLCELNGNNKAMVKFSNEQTRFVLLITTPIIIAVLLLVPFILQLLYSSKFLVAANLMRWQILGTFLKVLIWPIGFFLLAKGKGLQFFLVETSWYLVYYLATRLCWQAAGLESTGIAFLIAYVVYYPLVYFLVKPLCDFRFTRGNLLLMAVFSLCLLIAFLIAYYLHGWLCWICSILIFMVVSVIAVRELLKLFPMNWWKEKLMHLKR